MRAVLSNLRTIVKSSLANTISSVSADHLAVIPRVFARVRKKYKSSDNTVHTVRNRRCLYKFLYGGRADIAIASRSTIYERSFSKGNIETRDRVFFSETSKDASIYASRRARAYIVASGHRLIRRTRFHARSRRCCKDARALVYRRFLALINQTQVALRRDTLVSAASFPAFDRRLTLIYTARINCLLKRIVRDGARYAAGPACVIRLVAHVRICSHERASE